MHRLTRSRTLALLAVALVAAGALTVLLQPSPAEAQATCHAPGTDPEVLVLTTATALPRLCQRKAVEILNLGPNSIYCALGGSASTYARVGKAREVPAGASWSVDVGEAMPIYCIAKTAAQVSGAATIVTEIR